MQSRLHYHRENKNFTQAELANLVGISRQALSAIETGKQDPSLKTAFLIAQALGCSVDEIFYQDEVNTNEQKMRSVERGIKSNLSLTERLQLVNQYEILRQLSTSDSEKAVYERLVDIFRCGYRSLYHEVLDLIWPELPEDVAEETLSILDLHRALLWSLGEAPSSADIELVRFRGFDGNHESSYLAFARFYAGDGQKYQELSVVNSHHPTLQRYRRMLQMWEFLGKPFNLSRSQLEKIIDAGTFKLGK